tara:strand:+ start:905 stop:1429 length:525 start_codon:yes stop_codon:yes gene_type:complete
MRLLNVFFALILIISPVTGPALAAADLAATDLAGVDISGFNACIDAAQKDGTNPGPCIDTAQVACLDNARETPAVATLCYTEARKVWSGALSGTIAEMTRSADEKVAAVARIETKYNLLTNLMACDRVEELSRAVSAMPGEAIALQTARCQATASAATYMYLYLREKTLAAAKP